MSRAHRALADDLAAEPTFLRLTDGLELWVKGQLVVAVPPAVEEPPALAAAVEAARSTWLAGQCNRCGARPLLAARTGAITVRHHPDCIAHLAAAGGPYRKDCL